MYMIEFDLLALSVRGCMLCRQFIKWMFHSGPFCLWRTRTDMCWPNGWLKFLIRFCSFILSILFQTRSSLQRSADTEFFVSFDICSLFTNVHLGETIDICADFLCRGYLKPPYFPENVFVMLMEMSTKSVSFSFDNNMYQQTNGVAMGIPLILPIAKYFVGFPEGQLFDKVSKPHCYFRFVDDTFTSFSSHNEADRLFNI